MDAHIWLFFSFNAATASLFLLLFGTPLVDRFFNAATASLFFFLPFVSSLAGLHVSPSLMLKMFKMRSKCPCVFK
jgi:hypothetical protein